MNNAQSTPVSRRRNRLAYRLVAVSLGLYLTAAVIVTAGEALLVRSNAGHSIDQQLNSLTQAILPQLDLALWNLDTELMRTILSSALRNPAIAGAEIRGPGGNIVARAAEPGIVLPPGTTDLPGDNLGPPHSFVISHRISQNQLRAIGTLRIFPSSTVTRRLITQTVLFGAIRAAILVALLSLVMVIAVNRLLGRPLARLTEGIRAIDPEQPEEAGFLPELRRDDELGILGTSFNTLLGRLHGVFSSLRESERMLRELNATLESRVEERGRALAAAQDKLVEAGKMAALGQLVAGISHELNTPIGAVVSAARSLDSAISRSLPVIAAMYRELSEQEVEAVHWLTGEAASAARESDIRRSRKERKRVQALLEAEEFPPEEAAPLAAELAELGIPGDLGPVMPFLRGGHGHLIVRVAAEFASVASSVRIVTVGADKAASVVRSLRIYSHQDEPLKRVKVDLREEIDLTLLLHQSAIKRGIEVIRTYEPVPPVCCFRDRLNQVWMNLVSNAVQAMEDHGRLEIRIACVDSGLRDGSQVQVSIRNTGPTIPPEVAERIFMPFFSTKPTGAGVGLGLSISKQIVEEHGGTIDFASEAGETVFTVTLEPKLDCG